MPRSREILRLKLELGLSVRQVALSCGLSRPTVTTYVRRAEACGLSWPLPDALDDAQLERMLYPPRPRVASVVGPEPDWVTVHQELKRKGVTLQLLWDEYKAAHPQGIQYTTFCVHYRAWFGKQELVMRQDHRAGEKLFVDYAGQTASVIDRETGEVRSAQIFVAVMGASKVVPPIRTPRRPGRSGFPTGSAHMCAPWPSWAWCRRSWCRTTSNRRCVGRIATSRN